MIEFINKKYYLVIENSVIDKFNLFSNSWLTSFIGADGDFAVKIFDSKPESDTHKKSVSYNTSIVLRLGPRLLDKKNFFIFRTCYATNWKNFIMQCIKI